jgi:hypothetical protein
MDLGTSKYARRRQKKGKEDRSENPNKVQEYVGMEWDRDVKGNTSKLHQSVFCEKLLKDFG